MTIEKTLRSLCLAVALAFLAPLTGVGQSVIGIEAAQAQTVSRIEVSGNQRVDDATVRSYLTIAPGQAATSSAIQGSIASLNSTGLFSNVSVRYSGGVLYVSVSENAIVASVLFEGNQRFNDEQLLTMVNLGSRGSFTQDRLDADIRSIELAYDDAGYTNVTVDARTETVQNSRIRVVFVINEGEKAGIAAINFTGNNTFSAWQLKSVINTKESHLLSWLFQDDNYSEDMLAADRELLRRYYANRGFPDAQVPSAVAEFDASQNAYFVNFTINEGERYSFGDIGIETSISGLNTDALRGAIRTYQGDTYSQQDLQASSEEIAIRATGQGYAFADVRPRLIRDEANREFDVTYLVDEGARAYVERINITGNTKTRDFVIRRELDFAEGDPFNRSIVARGKSNIESLNFFSEVNLTTERGSASDQVVINIAVVEKATGDYGVSAGYSTQDGILGEVSLTERNFLGRGQYLKISVGASQSGQNYNFSFTEPKFMGLDISAGIDLYRRVNDESSSGSALYGSTANGGQVRFGVPITDDLRLTLNAGGQTKAFVDAETDDGADSDIIDDGDTLNKVFVGYNLRYTNVDNEQRPSSGLVASLTQQYVGLDHNHLKSEVQARYFIPVLQDTGVVASVRGQAGVINDFSGDGVHPTETFNLGPNLVRGFSAMGMGPRLSSGEALGAMAYAGISGEIEFPIPLLPENYGLRGAVWADAGWVGDAPSGWMVDGGASTPVRASVGGSIIWDSPFGPLRGDIAHVLQKDEADNTQVFQLSLQTLL